MVRKMPAESDDSAAKWMKWRQGIQNRSTLRRAITRAVLSGEIVAGGRLRLACRRRLDDLERGADRDLEFDDAALRRAIRFFSFLRHTEGQFAGKPFELLPFQKFIVGSLFGWKTTDGYRRFSNAYVETEKGNRKTRLAAGRDRYA